MKTRSLFGKKYLNISCRELELPELASDQLLVKVHACGVCGTDLNFVRDWEGEPQALGHEIAGEVLAVGAGVTRVRPGDRVLVEDCAMCGQCVDCKAGHPELCRHMHLLNGFPGMGEYQVVNVANADVFDGMEYQDACLSEPLAVALNAVLTADIPLGGSVVILGPGPIGLLCAAVARLRGAGFVGMVGRAAASVTGRTRLELAERLGAEVFLSERGNVETELRRRFPAGVDRVIVTSPPRSMYDAFRVIRYGGVITFLGLSFEEGKNRIDFDVNAAIFNKTTLRPVFAEPAIHFNEAAHLIRSGAIDAKLFQTHFCDFSDVQSVLKETLAGTLPVIKPVFLPWG